MNNTCSSVKITVTDMTIKNTNTLSVVDKSWKKLIQSVTHGTMSTFPPTSSFLLNKSPEDPNSRCKERVFEALEVEDG